MSVSAKRNSLRCGCGVLGFGGWIGSNWDWLLAGQNIKRSSGCEVSASERWWCWAALPTLRPMGVGERGTKEWARGQVQKGKRQIGDA